MNVATDTCVLINLLRVNRLNLLGALAPYVFHVPPEVVEEIDYPDQQQALQEAIRQGWIQQTRLEDPMELQTFARATAQLGKGESACIALAEKRGWVLGTDDSKGAKWKKVISAPGIQILNTPGIILLAVRNGVLTIEQADEIKVNLDKHRFLSVPKILTLFIPEILSHPAIAGRAKTLSVPPVGEPVGRREEDVRNVKASRSRDSTEGWSPQGRSGPSGRSFPVLC